MSVHMPKRSVTRFFVPLIDVLLLLFCIFLLMPMAEEDKLNNAANAVAEATGEAAFLKAELERDRLEVQRYEENQDIDAAVKKIKQLTEQIKKLQEQRTDIYALDIDGKANLTYFDRSNPQSTAAGIPITDQKIAKSIIAGHKEIAGEGRKVYYFFVYPRPAPASFPTGNQRKKLNEYRNWFYEVDPYDNSVRVDNSMRENQKENKS